MNVMIAAASERMQDNCQIARNSEYFPSAHYAALQSDQQRSFRADGREHEARFPEPSLLEQSADLRSDDPSNAAARRVGRIQVYGFPFSYLS